MLLLPRVTYRKAKITPGDNTQAVLTELGGTPSKKLRKSDENYLERYSKLYSLLWKREAELRDTVFIKKTMSVPEFAEDGSYSITVVEHDVLSLDGAIDEYLRDKPSEKLVDWERLLPCGSNLLLVREAYHELLDRIVELEKRSGYTSRDEASVTNTNRYRGNRAFIVSGQPGIGKTWFLSHVLVDRLLRGELTSCKARRTLSFSTNLASTIYP